MNFVHALGDWAEAVKKELSYGEPCCEVTLTPTQSGECLIQEDSEDILTLLQLLPNGVAIIKGRVPGEIGGAVSWTQVKTSGNQFTLRCGLRGESNYKLDRLHAQEKTLCEILNFTIEKETGFPAWEYDPDSQLCNTLKKVFRERMGKGLTTIEVQGWLECSIFCTIRKNMDIITLGPVGEFEHTTRERLQLKSFDEIFDVFIHFLAAL